MKIFLILLSLFIHSGVFAQFVGVNNNNPTESLDVNGNIKLNGVIKPNGSNGFPGQVLSRNNSGGMDWRSLSGISDENTVTFMATTAGAIQTFTVPAGVSRISVEGWGGGGSGGAIIANLLGQSLGAGGGGGGGYFKAWFTVSPGDLINISVGKGAPSSLNAGNTTCTAGAVTITALAGSNASASLSGLGLQTTSGRGGLVTVSNPSFRNYMLVKGADGRPVNFRTILVPDPFGGPSLLTDSYDWGDGGNGANSSNSGGIGGQTVGLGASYQYSRGSDGSIPGGGGGGDRNKISAGGDGLVILKY